MLDRNQQYNVSMKVYYLALAWKYARKGDYQNCDFYLEQAERYGYISETTYISLNTTLRNAQPKHENILRRKKW